MVNVRALPKTTPPEDIAEAARTLDAAFAQDGTLTHLSGGNADLSQARLRSSVTTSVLDLEAYVVDAEDAPGGEKFEAVMLVKPPGVVKGKSPNAKGPHTEAVSAVEATLDPALKTAFEELHVHMQAFETATLGPTGFTDFYYLSHLGVLPGTQGKGLGGACVRHILEHAKANGKAVALLTVSQGHVDYYARFGFKQRGVTDIDQRGVNTRWFLLATDP